jgi:cytochrome P450
VFQVTYGEKMEIVTGGQNFFLGMQNSPEYIRDVSHMRSVVRREDIPDRIAPFVRKTANDLVAGAGGRVDVVKLSKAVPARWIADYFGCPPLSDQQVEAWATVLFQYLFTDQDNDPNVAQAATKAAAAVRNWLDETIAARKANGVVQDDVLGRCLLLQNAGLPAMDDVSIRNNLLGLLVGAIPTTSKCCAQAMDQLFERPEQLQGAQGAALAARGRTRRRNYGPMPSGFYALAGPAWVCWSYRSCAASMRCHPHQDTRRSLTGQPQPNTKTRLRPPGPCRPL